MVKYPHMPGLDESRSGSLSCAHFAHTQQKKGAKSQKFLAHVNTKGKGKTPLIGIPHSGATFPCVHPPIGDSIFPQIEWDGSYVQKRFHSGRTDQGFGHSDRNNASGLGSYHFHHTVGPHMPCCRGRMLITYDKNGGEGNAPPPQALETGQPLELAKLAYPRDLFKLNHTFDGWNTCPNGTGEYYPQGQRVVFDSAITLYAMFTSVL